MSPLLVRHLPGWGQDVDLSDLDPDAPVSVAWVKVTPAEEDDIRDPDRIPAMIEAYRRHGPYALPPIVITHEGDEITGAHRNAAAREAGLTHLPAFVVVY